MTGSGFTPLGVGVEGRPRSETDVRSREEKVLGRRMAAGGLALAVGLATWTSVEAQTPGIRMPVGPELPMSYQYQNRQPVSPFFEGWYRNPDGTYTLSFGYFNRNLEETLEIPLGPNNFIEPAEFDGFQPTSFPAQPDYSIAGREWGVFTVIVPEEFAEPGNDVVWTIRSKGVTHSVPGRVGNIAYQLPELAQPMGSGSLPPKLRLEENGAEGVGQTGIRSGPETVPVGTPLTLGVWVADNFEPESREPVSVGVKWFKHQGPADGVVSFTQGEAEVDGSGEEAFTTVTFSQPGDYILRVRADNFSSNDSGDQRLCCWTNGYVSVTVSP